MNKTKALIDVQWALISIATASLAHFVLRIVLGREFGPEGLGVYTLAFTIYLLGTQFAAFAIDAALTKYVAEFLEDQAVISKYVSSGMIFSIIIGTIMGVVLLLLAPFISISFFQVPELESLIQLIALSYPFIAIQKTVLGTLNGFRKMHLYAFLNIIQNATVVATSITLVLLFKGGLMGAVIGLIGPTILIGTLCPFLIRNYVQLKASLWDTPALHAITVFGFYVVLGNSVSFLNAQVGGIMIGYYLNPNEVGIYAVAVLLAQPLTLIPGAVQRVTAPMTATLYGRGDIEGIWKMISSAMKRTFLISVAIALLIMVFGNSLITLLFTIEFLRAYVPLLILLAGQVIFAPFMAIGSTLASIGKVHISFRIHLVCGILNVMLNVLLIPYIGVVGAALSATITDVVSFIIHIHVIQKLLYDGSRLFHFI